MSDGPFQVDINANMDASDNVALLGSMLTVPAHFNMLEVLAPTPSLPSACPLLHVCVVAFTSHGRHGCTRQ